MNVVRRCEVGVRARFNPILTTPRRPRAAAALLAASAGLAAAPPCLAGGANPGFSDQTTASGLVASHAPAGNFKISVLPLPRMTAGAAVGDFNKDGWQDLFVVSGGVNPDRLFINNRDGTFTDRAEQWGVAVRHMGLGASVGDFDNDGWPDVYVTSVGPSENLPVIGQHRLYRNNRDGTFTNVAEAARVNRTSTQYADGFGSTFGDYDLDGDLDLFVAAWGGISRGNRLFRNNRDGTFTNVTNGVMTIPNPTNGFSPRFVDMNGDRYPELLLAADFGTSRYYINDTDGTFTDFTVPSGTGIDDNGMGHTVADFNNDGLFDWYVTSIYTIYPIMGVPGTGSMLYINQGNHVFVESSVPAGVNQQGWGWGTAALDVDHDGLQDIIATNGWHQANGNGVTEWAADPTCIFLNNGDGTFDQAAPMLGCDHTDQGRALCRFDYDNDGDQDFVIASYFGPLALFRNDLSGPGTNWLRVFLDTSNDPLAAPFGIGAKLRVTANGGAFVRYGLLDSGSTYLGQSELSAHFGLGAAPVIDELRIDWPNGAVTVLRGISPNQTITIPLPPACRRDWNASGGVDSNDFFSFLDDYFRGDGDYTRDGQTTSDDFFAFLTAFFGEC